MGTIVSLEIAGVVDLLVDRFEGAVIPGLFVSVDWRNYCAEVVSQAIPFNRKVQNRAG